MTFADDINSAVPVTPIDAPTPSAVEQMRALWAQAQANHAAELARAEWERS